MMSIMIRIAVMVVILLVIIVRMMRQSRLTLKVITMMMSIMIIMRMIMTMRMVMIMITVMVTIMTMMTMTSRTSSRCAGSRHDEDDHQHLSTFLIKTRLTYNCAHLRWTKESLTVEFGKKMCEKLFFHKVSDILIVTIGRYWLIHDSAGSV